MKKEVWAGVIFAIVISVGIFLGFSEQSSLEISESIVDLANAPSGEGTKIELSESMSMGNP